MHELARLRVPAMTVQPTALADARRWAQDNAEGAEALALDATLDRLEAERREHETCIPLDVYLIGKRERAERDAKIRAALTRLQDHLLRYSHLDPAAIVCAEARALLDGGAK